MKLYIEQQKLRRSKGLCEAVENYKGYMKPTFGGYWRGIIYAFLVFSAVVGYAHIGFVGASLAFPGIVFFWLCTKYDAVLVRQTNENLAQMVITNYVANNIHEFLDPQDVDSKENLDGTNEEE